MGSGFSIKAKANSEADIYIYEDIGAGFFGGVSAKQFADDLKALGKISTINLHLNSEGGDVFDGLSIYRLLVDHAAKVIAHIDGIAASIASVVAMAGDEIRIAEAGFIMIHDAWGLTIGNADDMRRMADTLEVTTGAIADVYAARTKNKRDKLRDWMRAETWFTGAGAVENGFADSVVENLRVAAKLDPAKHKYKNLPVALGHVPSEPKRPMFDSMQELIATRKALIERQRIQTAATA